MPLIPNYKFTYVLQYRTDGEAVYYMASVSPSMKWPPMLIMSAILAIIIIM